ncbi:MAG: hypothetical protein QOI41_7485 [Myxococcales bacterium]|nr:hypothetical protein [Myxococcales bacterium]
MKHLNRMMKPTLSLWTALLLATTAFDASAAGLAVDRSELPAKARASLESDVDKARIETPDLFRQVQDIAKRAGELDAGSRRPGMPLTMHFKVLGPRALMPMLDLLAFDGRAPSDLTPTARAALRVGLVEAVGIIRDERAVPVLSRIALRERDVDMTRASADALGRIGTNDAHAALLAALASADSAASAGNGSSERVHALLAGFGSSRRLDATTLLAKRLGGDASRPDAATAKALAKALGTAGNAWAWKTLTNRTDEAAVREIAARALVKAYVTYPGEARTAAMNALLVVDDSHTASLVAEARLNASSDEAAALDALSAKLAKNPTR